MQLNCSTDCIGMDSDASIQVFRVLGNPLDLMLRVTSWSSHLSGKGRRCAVTFDEVLSLKLVHATSRSV